MSEPEPIPKDIIKGIKHIQNLWKIEESVKKEER